MIFSPTRRITLSSFLADVGGLSLVDSQVQTWLSGKLNGELPAPDASTIYVLFYPDGATVTQGGGISCQSFGGYHLSGMLDPKNASQLVAYAVIPRCVSGPPGLSKLDLATTAASHEMLEAATDPCRSRGQQEDGVSPDPGWLPGILPHIHADRAPLHELSHQPLSMD